MFMKWYKKGDKLHHLDKVVKIEVVSTGDVQVHHLLDGRLIHTTLIRGVNYDSISVQDEEKQNATTYP